MVKMCSIISKVLLKGVNRAPISNLFWSVRRCLMGDLNLNGNFDGSSTFAYLGHITEEINKARHYRTFAQAMHTWWRHQMETFSLLALCEINPPVTSGFPSQKPVTQSFGVLFGGRLNKRLNQQWMCQWFETPWCPRDVTVMQGYELIMKILRKIHVAFIDDFI